MLGKILGGGLPAAAVGGPRELLELLAPVGEVYQAGTLSGNPLAVAAGLATLALLDDDAYATLASAHRAARRGPARGRRRAAGQRRLAPGLLTVFFAAAAAARPRRSAALRPRRATARGAASCWRAASIRRRRSSRPGSPRSRTATSRSSATLAAAARRSRARRAAAHERARASARRWSRPRASRSPAAARRRGPGARRRRRRRSPRPARAPPPTRPSTSCWSRRSTRATCCTTGSRASARAADRDLALLAGDRLYALGLERLVALGDLEAVRELADVIALCALLVGARRCARAASALWRAGARAVGWGADDAYEQAKSLLRAGRRAAAEALLAPRQRAHAWLDDILRARPAPQELRLAPTRRPSKSKYTARSGNPRSV